MALWSRSLEVVQNEDYSKVLGWASQDPSGNITLAQPISFSGCTAKMQVREGPSSTATQILALATGSGITLGSGTLLGISCGLITIALTNTQTDALPIGSWFYDLFIYSSAGKQVCYLQGSFIVQWSVTR
jgi:hypothetical protein